MQRHFGARLNVASLIFGISWNRMKASASARYGSNPFSSVARAMTIRAISCRMGVSTEVSSRKSATTTVNGEGIKKLLPMFGADQGRRQRQLGGMEPGNHGLGVGDDEDFRRLAPGPDLE